MKIGILKETVAAISPQSVAKIKEQCREDISIALEKFSDRVFNFQEYGYLGATEQEDLADCDVLMGINEPIVETLIPNKHYFFFGRKKGGKYYSKKLLKALIEKNITYTDFGYLKDVDDKPLCNIGFYAGIAGAYNTMRLWAIQNNMEDVGGITSFYSVDKLIPVARKMKRQKTKVLVSGDGNVSLGVQAVLRFLQMDVVPFGSKERKKSFFYSVVCSKDLVERIDGKPYDREDFYYHPEQYRSKFASLTEKYDVYIAAHKWEEGQPTYMREEYVRNANTRIKTIGDMTCEAKGSLQTTLKVSSEEDPFYGVKASENGLEICSITDNDAIAVTAVYGLYNALPKDVSTAFSTMLEPIILKQGESDIDRIIDRATVIKNGKITSDYAYLKDYMNT